MTLTVTDLRVHYRTLRGEVRALDGVSFDLADGEILGLAGESGCGKTTLGKSLIRLDGRMRHAGGTVTLDGDDVPVADDRAMNAFRFHRISLVPQYSMSALNPTRRIGRMIRELLASRGVSVDTPELHRRLDLVGLDHDVLNRYPIELSGGMKQRTVMVISTLLDPSVLIADEVTSALDVSTQRAVVGALTGLRDKGLVTSMIFVTHDLGLTSHIADSIMVMYAGKLAEKAPTKVLTTAPRHPYTKLLLGSLPEVGARYADKPLKGIAGAPPSLLNPPAGCRFRDRCPLADEQCAEEPRSWRSPPSLRRMLEGLMLTLDHVTKTYRAGAFGGGSVTAVDRVSFTAEPGEVVSLIGESGSGKSTIGRMILGLTGVSSGSLTLDGRPVRPGKDFYRRVQGVFQDPFSCYNPVFRADRVFDMIRRAYHPGVSDQEWAGRVEKAVRDVRLDPGQVLGRYPHQLSGGQLQRLLIARALLLDLSFLVADEITSMLDASTRIDVLNLLAALKERGLGVLYITHDLALGTYLAEKTVVLRRGRVVERGDTQKVFGNPLHPYTRTLLAAVPRLNTPWDPPEPLESCAFHEGGDRDTDLYETEPDHFVACAQLPDCGRTSA